MDREWHKRDLHIDWAMPVQYGWMDIEHFQTSEIVNTFKLTYHYSSVIAVPPPHLSVCIHVWMGWDGMYESYLQHQLAACHHFQE